ncbi:unnamed protein product [Aphanomyces euteiches]
MGSTTSPLWQSGSSYHGRGPHIDTQALPVVYRRNTLLLEGDYTQMRGNIVSTVIGLRHAAAVTLMLMTPKNTDSALQHPHAQQLSTSPPISTYNWPDNSPRTGCPIKTSTFPSNASLWPHPRLTFPAEPRGNMPQHEQPPHHTKAH